MRTPGRVFEGSRSSVSRWARVALGPGAIMVLLLTAFFMIPRAGAQTGDSTPVVEQPASSTAAPKTAQEASPPAKTSQPPAKLPAPLRYGWKPTKMYPYRVSIEADRVDYVDTWKGTPSYVVTSIEGDQAKLSVHGGLFNSRRPNSAGGPVGPMGPGMASSMLRARCARCKAGMACWAPRG